MKGFARSTSTTAWLAACKHLLTKSEDSWRDYNLILEIESPFQLPPSELAVVRLVDKFMLDHGGMPFNSVVNTIFPAQLYAKHGVSAVFDQYISELLPKLKKHPEWSWGTYAQRMLDRSDGKGGRINPLKDLIAKLIVQLKMSGPNRAVYEIGTLDPLLDIPLYDPAQDRNRPLGGPCLSHVSFKLDANHRLNLTALYRSHYYIQRALGNLFGLAHLQRFVADQAGIEVGTLTCISTVAQLELSTATNRKWGKGDVTSLISQCEAAVAE